MMLSFARLKLYFIVDCLILLLSETSCIKAQGNTEGSVRLRRGINSESGYVEIFHNGQWGRVCDTDWDHADAHVVCKQQGYNGAKISASVFHDPANLGLPINLDGFQCTGRETALATCPNTVWGQASPDCQTARVECVAYMPQYIGCYADDLNRLLPDYSSQCVQGMQDPRCEGCDFTNTACDSSTMTPQLCIEICCSKNNYTYAGLQAGKECYCGSATAQYAKINRLPEVLCSTQCSGDPQQSCGADYKLDVYDCSSGCEAPAINKPNLVTNPATTLGRLYNTGETIAFECEASLRLVGSPTLTCQPGGGWSHPVPDCVEPTPTVTPPESIPCPYPTSTPPNGQYTPLDVTYQPGSTVTLACNTGYVAAPDVPTLTCNHDGTWTTEQPTCTAIDCGVLPMFPHATPSTTVSTFDTTVTFTCDSGYQLTGGSTGKTCNELGHWIGADPQCAGGDTCDLPPSPNQGLFDPYKTTGYQPGETVQFSCYAGYRIEGASTDTCQTDGTWSDNVPTCEVVDCGPLPEYPFVTPITTATTFATSVTFRCDDLYQFANGATPFKTCDGDGLWVGIDPVCELIVCPPLLKYYRTVPSTNSTVINTVVTFTCDDGYQLKATDPSPSKTCTSGGIWEGPNPVCERSGCPPLSSYPSAVPSTEATDIGTVVIFTCRPGSVSQIAPVEPSKTCSPDKQWVGTDPDCIVDTDCGPVPVFPNAVPSTSQTTLYTAVSFQCEAGYQLVGSSAIQTCTPLGWQGASPSCREMTCGTVPTFPNALVYNSTGDQKVSATVTYFCEEGFKHMGENLPFMTCTEALQWEGTEAFCQVVNCGQPDVPAGVILNGTEFTFNKTLTFTCENETESIDGNAMLSCLSNGQWSSAMPNCTVIETTTEAAVSKGADSDLKGGIPISVWIVLLLLVLCVIILIASCVVYKVHTRAYKKYKKDNESEDGSAQIDSPGVPLQSIAIGAPKLSGSDNYGMTPDEEVDTGVASNDSDMQDVSLGSESNYPYTATGAYAESLRRQSAGAHDSGMYPSETEISSLGTEDDEEDEEEEEEEEEEEDEEEDDGESGGTSVRTVGDAGTSAEQARPADSAEKPKADDDEKDKDFIDNMKDKIDNCAIQ